MRKFRHSRSSEVSDLKWPSMTLDDIDTWQSIYSQFVGADSKSYISFALNNNIEAQDRSKVRIITAEMSHGNGPWHAWPCVTLTLGKLIWVLDIYKYKLCCLQCKNILQNAMKPRYDISQNPSISSEQDLTYDVTSSWPDISGIQNVQNMCKID